MSTAQRADTCYSLERRHWILCVKEHVQEGAGVDIQIRHTLLNRCISEQLKLFVQLDQVDRWPHMYKALSIAATIAFTSASCERSFSTLTFVKNLLRTTMLDERLSPLLVSYCESDVVKRLKNNDIMEAFACLGERRIML